MTTYAKKLIIIVGIVIFIIIGFYITRNASAPTVPEEAPLVTTPTEEKAITGCYVMRLAKDVYTLKIDSQTNGVVRGVLSFKNFEKDSSSGTFTGTFTGTFANGILIGDYSFSSEGMDSVRQLAFKKVGNDFVEGFGPVKIVDNKELFENSATLEYDSQSTFVHSPSCKEQFTNGAETISLEHSSFFSAQEGTSTPTLEWKVNAKQKGIIDATVTIPRAFMPETNFSGAKLTVGHASDKATVASCTLPAQDGSIASKIPVTVSGYPFTQFTFGDAGAGNLYDTVSYHGVVSGVCYVIEYTIHSTNIGNYSPDQGIKAFDEQAVKKVLTSIIESVKITVKK